MPLKAVDSASEQYAKDLEAVLEDLNDRITSVIASTRITGTDEFDATAILQARPIFIDELRNAGYPEIASKFIAEYPEISNGVKRSFSAVGIGFELNAVDAQTFQQIAAADLEGFSIIGQKAMDDLRQGLYKMAVQGQSFGNMVEAIRDATIGTTAKGSPLANFARTHANTAALDFSGQVSITAGENLGAEKWEILGPLDDATRDVCVAALNDPVRTKEEWIEAGYWGGTPGGWSCRHVFRPWFGDD